jgi:glycosyltransferase involved in cell wall biosynthesis
LKRNKTSKPLVSVVIPTYNAELYIQKCVQSVSDQTYKNIEILVVDDCSKDNTKMIIECLKIKNLKILKTKKNSGGPATPRNLGISKAKGKYIAFLDQDDLWEPKKLEICVNKMQNHFEFCYHQLKQKNNTILKNHHIDITKNPLLFLLNEGPIPTTSGVVVSRKTINKAKGFCESKKLIAGEDYDCWLKIAKMRTKFCFVEKSLGTYGQTGPKLTSPKNAINILNEIKKRHFKKTKIIPFWIHKSFVKNLFFTEGFFSSLIYFIKNIAVIQKSFLAQKY